MPCTRVWTVRTYSARPVREYRTTVDFGSATPTYPGSASFQPKASGHQGYETAMRPFTAKGGSTRRTLTSWGWGGFEGPSRSAPTAGS